MQHMNCAYYGLYLAIEYTGGHVDIELVAVAVWTTRTTRNIYTRYVLLYVCAFLCAAVRARPN